MLLIWKIAAYVSLFVMCTIDYRDPERIEHSVESLVKQRVIGIALGYKDLNDHDALLAVLSDKPDPTGANRNQAEDKGKALAGKSTLNRLELTPTDAELCSSCTKLN